METPRYEIDDPMNFPTSTQNTIIEAPQGRVIHNTPHSERSKSDNEDEQDDHVGMYQIDCIPDMYSIDFVSAR